MIREEKSTVTEEYMRSVLSATTAETVAHYVVITLTDKGEVGLTTDCPSFKHVDALFGDARDIAAEVLSEDWP